LTYTNNVIPHNPPI